MQRVICGTSTNVPNGYLHDGLFAFGGISGRMHLINFHDPQFRIPSIEEYNLLSIFSIFHNMVMH